jgi:hypothetical protein
MPNQQECPERYEALAGPPVDGLVGFTPEERERLERLRRQVRAGTRSDSYPIDKRQAFVRWLIAQGKLSDN